MLKKGTISPQVWVGHVDTTPTFMAIGDTTMVQNGTWHEAETHNSPPPDPASVPSMEGTVGTVLCQVEEAQGMAKDEGGLGDWNHSHWQVYYVPSDGMKRNPVMDEWDG